MKKRYTEEQVIKATKEYEASKPTQNAFVESFNGKLRNECLNLHWFCSIEDARDHIQQWCEFEGKVS